MMKLPEWMEPGGIPPWEVGLREVQAALDVTCAKCKQPYVLPAVADKRRPFVCDACYEAILREAAERIRIKVR